MRAGQPVGRKLFTGLGRSNYRLLVEVGWACRQVERTLIISGAIVGWKDLWLRTTLRRVLLTETDPQHSGLTRGHRWQRRGVGRTRSNAAQSTAPDTNVLSPCLRTKLTAWWEQLEACFIRRVLCMRGANKE